MKEQIKEKFGNLAIKASAGTGKTFRLAMRYISMLLCGIEPERILAITFTNKAAGEILEKIVLEALKRAEDPAELKAAIDKKLLPSFTTQQDMIRALQKLLATDKNLMISTIDSLFLKIVQAFPLECGILGKIAIQDESTIRKMQIRALLTLIRETDALQRASIVNELNQATFGSSEKSLIDAMSSAVLQYCDVYMNEPSPGKWGNLENPYKAYALDEKAVKAIGDDLNRLIAENGITDKKFISDVQKLTESALTYANGTRILHKNAKELFKSFDKAQTYIVTPDGTVPEDGFQLKKTLLLDRKILTGLRLLFLHLLALEIKFINDRTTAVFSLLQRFNEVYTKTARKAGALSFADIPYLITGNDQETCFGRIAVLEERLDSRIDHYMLDEFQDTSDRQWALLENLVNEVFQANPDDERKRSFFYVGDIKQSIYQWRQGNPKLFERILNDYNKIAAELAIEPIAEEPLTESFRSSTYVIGAVNSVFCSTSPAPALYEDLYEDLIAADNNLRPLQKLMVAENRLDFQLHSSAPSAAKQPGCAMLLEVDTLDDHQLQAEQIYAMLRKIDPFSKKRKKTLSVGILLRNNTLAADYLEEFRLLNNLPENRDRMIPFQKDGDMVITDSMAVATLIQMLRYSSHPSDKFAEEYLNMLRFSAADLDGLDSLNRRFYPADWEKYSLPENIRNEIAQTSLYDFVCHFRDVFCGLNEADTVRLNITADAAMQFEGSDTDLFVSQLETAKYKTSVGRNRNAVEIMTIHKSKGLDFDIVFLPENGGKDGITQVNLANKIVVDKDKNDETKHIAFLAASDMLSALAEQRVIKNKADHDSCYEALCLLYVAMTRAKKALYMFVSRKLDADGMPKKKSKEKEMEELRNPNTIRYETLLRRSLDAPPEDTEENKKLLQESGIFRHNDVLYLNGDIDWYDHLETVENAAAEEETEPAKPAELLVRTHRRAEQITPSALHDVSSAASYRFAPQKSADIGVRVHEIFAGITTIQEFDPESVLTPLESAGEIGTIVKGALRSDAIREKLSDPGSRLWREKHFLITGENGAVVSGCFDRVTVHDDPDGNAVSAEVIDFKTDVAGDDSYYIGTYSKQLELYRRTLAKMLSLPEEKIRCTILALRHGKVISLTA